MKLYAPKYYKSFKCIADRCKHSCCVGWEIDVDGKTLEKYKGLKSEYSKNIEQEGTLNSNSEKGTLLMQQALKKYAEENGSEAIPLCVKVEEELATLEDEEKAEMLELMGIEEPGLDKLIKASYKLLNLMSFLTAGEPEVRAWTITIGTKAPAAAGKIHSDIERGFIKAEVVGYSDLIECGSLAKAREKGLIRIEGKEYVMQDGDVVLFRFNV
jgi:ribosome-binding ATPase YchF (GTP1/OBG family)